MFWSNVRRGNEATQIRVGPLTIDRREQVASMRGRPLNLSPLLLKLLSKLAERPGRIVARAELKHTLWPYAERIDTERRLNTAVRALRVALGDDGDSPRLIETVRSSGYRWIAEHRRAHPALAAISLVTLLGGSAMLPAIRTAERAPPSSVVLMQAQAAVDNWRQAPTQANLRDAKVSVSRASRAAELPAIHMMQAQLALEGQWDWTAAEWHYRRALILDPDNADAQLGLAWLEANRGHSERALALVERLAASSALTEDRRANLGWLLIRLDRPALAAATCRANRASSMNLLSCAHTAEATLGRMDAARQIAVDLMAKAEASSDAMRQVQEGAAAGGYNRFLKWRSGHFLPASAPWFQKAQVLAEGGRPDEALTALTRSVAAREPLAVKIGSTPSFANMRSDQRFRALARQVGVRV